MKKSMIVVIALLLIVVVGAGAYYLLKENVKISELNNNGNQNSGTVLDDDENNSNDSNDNNNQNTTTGKKILVVYYSAQKHTEEVAKKIANNLGADIFEIVPKEVYTSEDLNWSNENSRVSKEHADESKRNVEITTTKVENWESYDTVLIGYPIWWGIAAWPVNTFVKANDFTEKTVIPFCTSASSGLGQSGKLLENMAKGGNWREGQRFSSTPTDKEIKAFTDNYQ